MNRQATDIQFADKQNDGSRGRQVDRGMGMRAHVHVNACGHVQPCISTCLQVDPNLQCLIAQVNPVQYLREFKGAAVTFL